MRHFDAEAVAGLGHAAAIAALTDALVGGLDPSTDPPRTSVRLAHGEFLMMPSESPTSAGVKVVTIAPANAELGLPRIYASYLLFDHETLQPTATLDGTALTTLRTPAVSVAAVLPRLPDRALRVAIVGSGPQATGHAAAFGAVRPLEQTSYLVRDPARTTLPAIALGSDAASDVLGQADVVVCATTARAPVFDSALLHDGVVVVAVGSHEPEARELDGALLGRSTVLVEDVATALREAGDVVLAIGEGALRAEDLVPIGAYVTGKAGAPADRPLVFKSVGMSWEDLVVAEAVAASSTLAT